jgi:citrate lyase subunit beta/citryl-CoA lyase
VNGVGWLFCPADRPERFEKAAAAADVVILDLEDGVGPSDRPSARLALAATPLDPSRTVVRISPVGTPDHELDIAALADTDYDTVMLAKTETADQVSAVSRWRVVALCETPLGVLNSAAIVAHAGVDSVMWGAEDLLAALGGTSSRGVDGRYRTVAEHSRSTVLLAAGAAAKPAIDSVYLDIRDLDGLAAETADAVGSGFAAKACIHPSQVDVVRAAYRPADDQVDWARRVLAAAEASDRGVFAFEGRMVDEPILRHARLVVSRS